MTGARHPSRLRGYNVSRSYVARDRHDELLSETNALKARITNLNDDGRYRNRLLRNELDLISARLNALDQAVKMSFYVFLVLIIIATLSIMWLIYLAAVTR